MKVVLFYPEKLPATHYGGTQRVVLWLARGLLQRGHRVAIACLPGSKLPAGCDGIAVTQDSYLKENFQKLFPLDTNIVHLMTPLPQHLYESLHFAWLLTVHGNAQEGEQFPENTVFLSQNHAQRHGARVFVYNGIDPEELMLKDQPGSKYLFLSQTNWSVKNLVGAMRYCREARVPLQIAGGNRPWWRRFQCWFHPSWKWIGPVGGVQKARLLAEAKALIFPVLWPEPFGLVVVEALMSGTPVIASPWGSLPELVPKDVGMLARTSDEWRVALRRNWTRSEFEACRQWAYHMFHYQKMTSHYEVLYHRLLAGECFHATKPIGSDWKKSL
jgi:glycosyltransferase involved in cell wall biosynthesis